MKKHSSETPRRWDGVLNVLPLATVLFVGAAICGAGNESLRPVRAHFGPTPKAEKTIEDIQEMSHCAGGLPWPFPQPGNEAIGFSLDISALEGRRDSLTQEDKDRFIILTAGIDTVQKYFNGIPDGPLIEGSVAEFPLRKYPNVESFVGTTIFEGIGPVSCGFTWAPQKP